MNKIKIEIESKKKAKSNLIFLLIFLFSSTYASSDVEKNFKDANNQFLSGDYQKSIEAYEKIISEGYSGASLYYNLANAYYRVGKIGLAILYYEKAKLYDPYDEDINHNLQFLNLQTKDKIEKLPTFFLFKWWEELLSFLTINQLTIIAYIFFILILISVLFYVISKEITLRRIGFYSAIISIIFLLFFSVLLSVKLYRENNIKYGIILTSSVIVKSSPDPSSKEAFIIHEGLKVKIEDKVEHWFKIRLEDGKIGWIEKNSLGVI